MKKLRKRVDLIQTFPLFIVSMLMFGVYLRESFLMTFFSALAIQSAFLLITRAIGGIGYTWGEGRNKVVLVK